ncbi:MAG TPA: LuxR C-terminal-related transcriptional regulator, partial [Thermomicrobiaceae bacterium]|nr:LuxR C-terminal-related transcriptional regulator [Thermomicrobiaceae bacterium]
GASLVKLGEMDRATNALLAGLAGHQTVGDLTFSVFGLLSLATALAAWSQPELAARVLGALLGFSDRAGTPLAPRTQREFDEIAARTGVVLGAAEFDRTLAQGRDLTLEQVIAMARSVLSTPADDAAAPDPDALTRRQLEVARLVARGLSDRQIADELSISVATVGVHVHQLLKKLDLRSRWQVAAALAERKLLDPSR